MRSENSNHVWVVAEAGVNHNGSVAIARKLIEVAAKAGADAVKFQTFKTERVLSRHAFKAEYQKSTTPGSGSAWEMIKKLELSDQDHGLLKKWCQQQKIEFLSTPFDLPSVDFLAKKMRVAKLKIPSGEITNAPLLWKAAQTRLPIILSTGMATLKEVEQALGVIACGYLNPSASKPSTQNFRTAFKSQKGQKILKQNVILLHCVTEYPAPFESLNLRAMDTLKDTFGLRVGYSDHSAGILASVAAAARGAVLIEKHFTLDKSMDGPDHRASLEPEELKNMVAAIRQVEKMMGSGVKSPAGCELKNKPVARKSLVTIRAIKKGESFSEKNIEPKRPGTGKNPFEYWDLLGKKALKNYEADEILK